MGRWRAEYAAATKKRKGEILDALCEATGWSRKHAIEALKELPLAKGGRARRRKAKYGPNEEAALVKVWRLSGFLSSKRLAPFLGATFLGVIPGTAVFALAGAGLGRALEGDGPLRVLTPEIIIALCGLAATALLAIPLRRWLAKR